MELAELADGSVDHVWRAYQLDDASDQPHARDIGDELARHVAALAERLELASDPALRPYAISWLVERNLARPDELTPDDVPTATIDVLAASRLSGADADELARMLQGPTPSHDRAVRFVEERWRVASPHTAPVLATLSQADDATLAKAASDSLNRYHGDRAAS